MPPSAPSAPRPRIGLFGGTFNPVHDGHLAIAADALRLFHLDELWLIPAASPPLKPHDNLAPDADRLAMLRLAIAHHGDPRLRADDIESALPAPSYTYRTVLALRERHPDADFAFLIGSDSLTTLHLWHRILELLDLIPFLILARPHHVPAPADIHLPPPYPEILLANLRVATLHPASSTAIRASLAATRTAPHLAPPVLDYILSRHLYGT